MHPEPGVREETVQEGVDSMTRALPAGSIHDMLGAAFDTVGRKAASDALGISPSMLSRHADPCEEVGRPMPTTRLDQMARLFPAAAAVIARHFAALAGGSFQPQPETMSSPNAALADLQMRLADASAELLAALDPAGPGGAVMTDAERRRAHARVAPVIDAAMALDAALSGVRS
jgi:hypothetical protein